MGIDLSFTLIHIQGQCVLWHASCIEQNKSFPVLSYSQQVHIHSKAVLITFISYILHEQGSAIIF